ncbi:hypothetical protein I4U23_005007 [Adineta vaga]|nr:hypothetical protein I4U23_005007 [Adineta vaga]
METIRHRSERSKKPKQIFSPSDPIQPHYYLVSYDYPAKYRIIGRTSIQQLTNDKAVINNVNGQVQVITSGTLDQCRQELNLRMQESQLEDDDVENDEYDETNDDDEHDDDDNNNDCSSYNNLSTNVMKRPSDGFRTPALKRSKKIGENENRARNFSLDRNQPIRSSIHVAHNNNGKTTTHRSRQENIAVDDARSDHVLQTANVHSNENIDNADINVGDSDFKRQMVAGMRLVQQNISKLTKKVANLTVPSSSKSDSLDAFRTENDSENFPSEVIWKNINLLNIVGRDPGDYGRQLLRELFTEAELKSSLLPSQSAHLYQKDVLDPARFEKLNEAIRVKYKLSHDGYRRYYTNSLRVKLSRFLYDFGSRKERQRTVQRQAATTNEIPRDPDFIITNTQNSYPDLETVDVEHKD